MRLIDADALYKSFGASGNCNNCSLDAYKCQYYNEHTLMEFCEHIDDAPTIEAEPTRRGHWIYKEYGHPLALGFYTCSACGSVRGSDIDNYCPKCGAKMDEEEQDNDSI